jgi:hypothetical protein
MTRLFLEIKNITLCAEPSFFILSYFLCKNLLLCVLNTITHLGAPVCETTNTTTTTTANNTNNNTAASLQQIIREVDLAEERGLGRRVRPPTQVAAFHFPARNIRFKLIYVIRVGWGGSGD